MFMRHCHKYIMGHNLHLLLSLFSLSLHYPSLPFFCPLFRSSMNWSLSGGGLLRQQSVYIDSGAKTVRPSTPEGNHRMQRVFRHLKR